MRHGNKTVVCNIWPDNEMPYLVTETETDEYGVEHPIGVRERVDLITNSLSVLNRTIPLTMIEGSVTFILDRVRKHAATLPQDEAIEFILDVIGTLNHKEAVELRKIYNKLDEYEKKKFVEDCISLNPDGTLMTNNGLYVKWEAFSEESSLRDPLIKLYTKYPDILAPYDIFVPKPKWGRDIYIGKGNIGYQYMLMLKQSGAKGFSIRSTGSISEEGLPEKTRISKSNKALHSSKPMIIIQCVGVKVS